MHVLCLHTTYTLPSQEQMLQTCHTLDLVQVLFCWMMLAALEMKQTSHNASTMGWEFNEDAGVFCSTGKYIQHVEHAVVTFSQSILASSFLH